MSLFLFGGKSGITKRAKINLQRFEVRDPTSLLFVDPLSKGFCLS